MQPLPGIRIRRLRLAGVSRNYDVDFTQDQRVRDLSVVAGAFSSGKTAVLEFIAYGLGGKRHPRHPEVLRKVRSSNERIASKNFLFENEYMKELGARLTQARSELAAARAFVDEQEVPTVGALSAEQYEGELRELTEQLRVLDETAQAGTTFAGRLRREHQQAAQRARRAAGVVRDCETQPTRMTPLRAQYADDLVKLNMLAEAQRLFDPLSVTTCPACLNRLPAPPSVENGWCGLCSHELPHGDGHLTLGTATAEHSSDEGAAECRGRGQGRRSFRLAWRSAPRSWSGRRHRLNASGRNATGWEMPHRTGTWSSAESAAGTANSCGSGATRNSASR